MVKKVRIIFEVLRYIIFFSSFTPELFCLKNLIFSFQLHFSVPALFLLSVLYHSL